MSEPTTEAGRALDAVADVTGNRATEYILAIEAQACQQERDRIRERVPQYVAVAIAGLRDGGGVSWNEATAIGERVARAAIESDDD